MNYIPPVPLVLKFLTNLNLNIGILILPPNNNLFGPVLQCQSNIYFLL